MSLEQLVGPTLLKSPTEVIRTSEITADVIGVYFSAHWCPPCRQFTPVLAKIYAQAKQSKKSFEIIFKSSDKSDSQFQEYYKSMPWLAIPFAQRSVGEALSVRFGINSIPTLLLFDKKGELLERGGVQLIRANGANILNAIPEKGASAAATPPCPPSRSIGSDIVEIPNLPEDPEVHNYDIELLFKEIETLEQSSDEKRVCLKLIDKAICNLVEHPEQKTFWILKKSNKAVERLTKEAVYVKILKKCGFREDENYLVCKPQYLKKTISEDTRLRIESILDSTLDE